MHDHARRGKRFCPMMKEMCINGWTKNMGEDPETGPRHGICAAWQPVSTLNRKDDISEEVMDCSIFGWTPDLLCELSAKMNFAVASTDKVATEVGKQHATNIAMATQDEQQRLLASDPRRALLPNVIEPMPQIENQKNGGDQNE